MSISINEPNTENAEAQVNTIQPSINFCNEVSFGELLKDIKNYVTDFSGKDKNITNEAIECVVTTILSIRQQCNTANHLSVTQGPAHNKFFQQQSMPLVSFDSDKKFSPVEVGMVVNDDGSVVNNVEAHPANSARIPYSLYRILRDSHMGGPMGYGTQGIDHPGVLDCFAVECVQPGSSVHLIYSTDVSEMFNQVAQTTPASAGRFGENTALNSQVIGRSMRPLNLSQQPFNANPPGGKF